MSATEPANLALQDASERNGDGAAAEGEEALAGVIQRLSLARSVPEVQEIVRTAARRLTGADGATFVLRDGEHCYYADEDAISPLWRGQRFPLESCVSGWAMLNRRSALIVDIYEDERIPHEAYRPTFVKSLAMVPIRQLDPIGAIGNYWAHHHEATAREVALLQALADSTAVAMENVKVYEELERAHAETLKRVTLAAENERRRWARELHDQTLQSLAGLRMGLAGARRGADLESWRRAGDEAIARIEGEIANLRAIINDLRPPALDQLGLYAAMEALAHHHQTHGGLHVKCLLPADRPALGAELETTVYRLVQEALTNVVKHAHARRATVRVAADDELVQLEVADEGVGFDPVEPAGGYGLTGLRERAGLVGGVVSIEPGVDGGTVVRATIPRAEALAHATPEMAADAV
ncbi:MAG TPA: GAF domain-containing sensor histidine kinase [Solirubrobacteraceae bacterium]|nr:GAF domain-containing sensor histidine kinase [Solirubrobacteraceae bacterium]